jgi:hypothetical protein
MLIEPQQFQKSKGMRPLVHKSEVVGETHHQFRYGFSAVDGQVDGTITHLIGQSSEEAVKSDYTRRVDDSPLEVVEGEGGEEVLGGG